MKRRSVLLLGAASVIAIACRRQPDRALAAFADAIEAKHDSTEAWRDSIFRAEKLSPEPVEIPAPWRPSIEPREVLRFSDLPAAATSRGGGI